MTASVRKSRATQSTMPGNYIPRLSIGLPVRNGESVIERAIDSLLNQTFTDLECIVVDDGSVDDTRQVVQSIDEIK